MQSSPDTRAVALGLAVSHHNAGNLTNGALPSEPSEVVATSVIFEDYILNGKSTR